MSYLDFDHHDNEPPSYAQAASIRPAAYIRPRQVGTGKDKMAYLITRRQSVKECNLSVPECQTRCTYMPVPFRYIYPTGLLITMYWMTVTGLGEDGPWHSYAVAIIKDPASKRYNNTE
jgi:hypothetical protein